MCSRILLEKLTVAQVILLNTKFNYRVHNRPRLALLWASWIQSITSHTVPSTSILTLSYNSCLCLLSDLFCSHFAYNPHLRLVLYALLILPFHVMTLIISGVQIMKFRFMQFSTLSCYLHTHRSNMYKWETNSIKHLCTLPKIWHPKRRETTPVIPTPVSLNRWRKKGTGATLRTDNKFPPADA
jgi:hypothetical protein